MSPAFEANFRVFIVKQTNSCCHKGENHEDHKDKEKYCSARRFRDCRPARGDRRGLGAGAGAVRVHRPGLRGAGCTSQTQPGHPGDHGSLPHPDPAHRHYRVQQRRVPVNGRAPVWCSHSELRVSDRAPQDHPD